MQLSQRQMGQPALGLLGEDGRVDGEALTRYRYMSEAEDLPCLSESTSHL